MFPEDSRGYERNNGRRATPAPVRADRFVDEMAAHCRTNGCASISLRVIPMIRKTGSWVKDVQVSPVRVEWTPDRADDSLHNFLQENPTGELTLDTRYAVEAFDDAEMIGRTTVDFSDNQPAGGTTGNLADKISKSLAQRTEQMVEAMLGLGGSPQGGGTVGGFNAMPYGMVRVGESEFVPASEVGSVIELERTRNRTLAERLEKLEKKAEKGSGALGQVFESIVERAIDIGERYFEKRIDDQEESPRPRRRRSLGNRPARRRRRQDEDYDDDYEEAEADEHDEYEDEDEDEQPAPRRRQPASKPRGRRVPPSVGMDSHFDPINTAAGRDDDEDEDYYEDDDNYDDDTDAPFYSALDDEVYEEEDELPPAPTVGGTRKKLTEERMSRVVQAVYETLYKHCAEHYTVADMTTRFRDIKQRCVELAKDVFGPSAISHNISRQDMIVLTANPTAFYELVIRLLPGEAQKNRIVMPAIKRVLAEFCSSTNWADYIDEVWG